jgi:hypothetical protein
MSKISQKLGSYLSEEFERKNEKEGRSYADPLTWREIAIRNNIPENSLIRWKEGINPPTNPEHIAALVNEFGAEVLVILGLVDRDVAFFLDHLDKPGVREVFEEAKEKAKKLVDGGRADVGAYNLASS